MLAGNIVRHARKTKFASSTKQKQKNKKVQNGTSFAKEKPECRSLRFKPSVDVS